MAVTTFNVDEKMDATLESLKEHYGATSKAEILRKAVALLKVAQESEQSDGSLVIRKGDQDVKVLVR
jgi:hypothetical protein